MSNILLAELTDEELLELYLATKNNDYFKVLVERHEIAIQKCVVCKYLDGDDELARDVAQMTFMKLIEEQEKYDRSKKLGPWLFSVAINLSIDIARANGRRFAHSFDGLRVSDDETKCWHTGRYEPEDYREEMSDIPLSREEMAEQVKTAITTLSDGDRAAVELVYYTGLNFKQAAAKLNIPLGSFKVRMRRAHRLIKGRLGFDLTEAA